VGEIWVVKNGPQTHTALMDFAAEAVRPSATAQRLLGACGVTRSVYRGTLTLALSDGERGGVGGRVCLIGRGRW
jgi:hypothetical protein